MFKKQQGIEFIDLKSKSGQERKFFKVKYLGSGGFARCYEVYEETDGSRQHYAFKIIKKSTLYQSKQLIERLRAEIRLHKKFSSPDSNEPSNQHIVRFIQSFETQDYIYLLLQLCVNQTLNELIRRRKFLTEEQTRFYIWQLAVGLKEIHSKNVVHRDIKLCNLFLSTGLKVKIGDFGLANEIKDNRRRFTVCGTANYIAPEMIRKDENGSTFGHGYEVDVWALGVVCYTIFYGKYPFEAQQEQSIYNKVLACKYSFNPYSMKQMKQLNINGLNHFPSQELKSFIKGIFQLDPSKRLTLDEVLDHQFLNKTSVPKELPQIALKCPLKKENLEKMFVVRNGAIINEIRNHSENHVTTNKYLQQSSNTVEPQKQTIDERITHQNITENAAKEQITINKISFSQSQNHQNASTKEIQKHFQTIRKQTIKEPFLNVDLNNKIANDKIYFMYQRKKQITAFESGKQRGSMSLKDQSQSLIAFNKTKNINQNLLVEIIFSMPQNLPPIHSPRECYSNGLMVKVYNLKELKEAISQHNKVNAITSLQNQYTIIVHPKLNYLTKVVDSHKIQTLNRTPLEEVPELPKNKPNNTKTQQKQQNPSSGKDSQSKQLEINEKDNKKKYVIKIPLTRSYSAPINFNPSIKSQNNHINKYHEQLHIVRMVFKYLQNHSPKQPTQTHNFKSESHQSFHQSYKQEQSTNSTEKLNHESGEEGGHQERHNFSDNL